MTDKTTGVILTTESSREIGQLVTALATVQSQMDAVSKDVEGQIGQKGYKYADLAAVVATAQPLVGNAGLAIVQTGELIHGQPLLATTLAHKSGEWIRGRCFILDEAEHKGINAAQAHGAAMQYAKRYGYCAILGIVTNDDDDGASSGSSGDRNNGHGHQPAQSRGPAQTSDRKFPSDESADAVCLSFKSPPNDEKKNQLKANGFVWNSGKFRWEAMPTDTALGLGRRILDSYSHLIKAHKGLEPPPAETATGQDGDDHDPPPPDGGETPPATEDAPAAASDVDNPTGMAGGDSGDPPSDDQTEDDAPDFDGMNKATLLGKVKAMEADMGTPDAADNIRPKPLSEMNKADLVAWAVRLHDITAGGDQADMW